jgi:hypothetical protein
MMSHTTPQRLHGLFLGISWSSTSPSVGISRSTVLYLVFVGLPNLVSCGLLYLAFRGLLNWAFLGLLLAIVGLQMTSSCAATWSARRCISRMRRTLRVHSAGIAPRPSCRPPAHAAIFRQQNAFTFRQIHRRIPQTIFRHRTAQF